MYSKHLFSEDYSKPSSIQLLGPVVIPPEESHGFHGFHESLDVLHAIGRFPGLASTPAAERWLAGAQGLPRKLVVNDECRREKWVKITWRFNLDICILYIYICIYANRYI